jgi:hypothetical protein
MARGVNLGPAAVAEFFFFNQLSFISKGSTKEEEMGETRRDLRHSRDDFSTSMELRDFWASRALSNN